MDTKKSAVLGHYIDEETDKNNGSTITQYTALQSYKQFEIFWLSNFKKFENIFFMDTRKNNLKQYTYLLFKLVLN